MVAGFTKTNRRWVLNRGHVLAARNYGAEDRIIMQMTYKHLPPSGKEASMVTTENSAS